MSKASLMNTALDTNSRALSRAAAGALPQRITSTHSRNWADPEDPELKDLNREVREFFCKERPCWAWLKIGVNGWDILEEKVKL
jgi:hypothetical protein